MRPLIPNFGQGQEVDVLVVQDLLNDAIEFWLNFAKDPLMPEPLYVASLSKKFILFIGGLQLHTVKPPCNLYHLIGAQPGGNHFGSL